MNSSEGPSSIVGSRSGIPARGLSPSLETGIPTAKLISSFILSVLFTYTATAQTTYTWNGGSGDWNVATNWTPVGVPGASDNAIINSGTVTLTTDVTVAGVELSGALSGGFDLEITNLMIWNSGVMQGAGITRIAVGATLRLSGTNQQTLRRQVENDGTTIWEAGQFALFDGVAFNNNGTFILTDFDLGI